MKPCHTKDTTQQPQICKGKTKQGKVSIRRHKIMCFYRSAYAKRRLNSSVVKLLSVDFNYMF